MGYRDQSATRSFESFAGGASKGIGPVGDAMRKAVIATLRFYKRFLSPYLPSACRYQPTCSEYMLEAVSKYGVARGISLGVRRLLRCHPFRQGGFDPVR
jgi:putative membrane protein insertion efficiency factor